MGSVRVDGHPLPGPPHKGEGDIGFLARYRQSAALTLPLVGRDGRG